MFALVIVGYAIVVLSELLPLYKKKDWKDFWVSTGITALSFATAVCLSFGVKIPSPANPIKQAVSWIFGLKS